MKFAAALLLLVLPAFAADVSKDEKDVLAAVASWRTASLKKDAAALDKLYHKDLTYGHSSAAVETKAEAIASITSIPASVKMIIEYRDLTVHIYGSTAVVKGKFDITTKSGVLTHLDALLVWLKTPEGWQLVARESVKLPEPAPAPPAK